jgi:hypothetical protein
VIGRDGHIARAVRMLPEGTPLAWK